MCLVFISSGILIGKSYKEWQDNPVATSTHVIDDLVFPMVAVCAPKDSNTALYRDLTKLGNISFFEKDREALNEAVYNIFWRLRTENMSLATPTSKDLNH